MQLKPIIFALALLTGQSAYAQLDWAIRANSGIATKAQLADGYYFSFDVGIPITRYLQIAPTFSFSSISSGRFFYNSWDSATGFPSTSIPAEIPSSAGENQDLVGSVSLLVLLNPFKIFSDQTSKHELLIGTGYGYKSYTQANTNYRVDGQNVALSSFRTKANSGFEPYFFKLMYNYAFRENIFGGIVAGMDGYDGDAVTNTGLQFGVRF